MDYQEIDEEKEYKVYPQRFQVSILFALGQMMTSVLMNTLNPIAAELSFIYGYEPYIINLGIQKPLLRRTPLHINAPHIHVSSCLRYRYFWHPCWHHSWLSTRNSRSFFQTLGELWVLACARWPGTGGYRTTFYNELPGKNISKLVSCQQTSTSYLIT